MKFGWPRQPDGSEPIQDFETFKFNGQYCKSGMAFYDSGLGDGVGGAECVDTIKITQYDSVTNTDKNLTAASQY